jgi:sulfide dehydrogenase cytochrome subunit
MRKAKRETHCVLSVVMLLGVAAHVSAADRDAEALSVSCNGCHGPDGVSYGASIPSIAGLDAEYLSRVLTEYKEGRRTSTIMKRIAKGYKGWELRKMARYFSTRPWVSLPSDTDPEAVEYGRRLHREHCEECHEDSGRYQDKDVPRIAGQRPDYLLTQLRIYWRDTEPLPQPTGMAERLALIEERELAALSAFYSSVVD